MYNRYIPGDAAYDRVDPQPPRPQRPPSVPFLQKGKELPWRGALSGLMQALHPEEVDSGDILLAILLLYLLIEGEDLEPAIAVGLVLLMGLGGRGKGKE